MEETTGTATSVPSETASSSASVASTETVNYQVPPNQGERYPNNADNIEVETSTGERVSLPTLKTLLQRQLEYYFSRENLQTDEYLQSQMDADGFVSISTISQFNQVRRLTDDINLVVEVLRESAVVQVDDAGEKVRSNPRSGVLILREIPESTPIKDFEELFSSENCPKFLRCEFAHNNSWYVLFESDADTQKAYQYLREEAKTFHGKPVMARIKAKAVTSAPFTNAYKNGTISTAPEAEPFNAQNINQTQQPPMQYTYTNVPNESYNNQQVCPPFYPPTMLQTWAPTTPACVDLGTVLSVNGLSPQAAFRPLNSNSTRHNYASNRDSEQNRYFNRSQSTSYLQRQPLQQQAFPNLVNANNCAFDYVPYASRSRNLHNFGVDMNFFTAPNLYYSKLPSLYPAHSTQTRHNPVMVPRNQVGIGAINNQDQSYMSMSNNASVTYSSRESGASGTSSSSTSTKQSADNQTRENWMASNRQRNKRWWKENGASNNNRNFSENSNGASFNKSQSESDPKPESPKFDLETTSFPPLPGSACMETVEDNVYESRLSDIVKGTVRPTGQNCKASQTSEAGVCTTSTIKDTVTVVDEAVLATDSALTPPASPEIVKETAAAITDALIVENYPEPDDWDDFANSPNDSRPSSTSINMNNVVPEVPFNASNSSPAFLTVSTNSLMNGSVVIPESAVSTSLPETEPITNVPSEIAESKQTTNVAKMPKAKQSDSVLKSKPVCDTQSPKIKSPDASSIKNKYDAFKDRPLPKHNRTFSNNKNSESSCKERVIETSNAKTIEHGAANKCSDVYASKEKFGPKRVLETNKAKSMDEPALLSVNGHADSESTVSSEDEKPFRKLTYSEVAMRAKEKVEKIAQELKEKERQEAMVRQHRQQDVVTQNRQPIPRGPLREIPRGRIAEARPGSKEWRERRKPARAISLPATGQ